MTTRSVHPRRVLVLSASPRPDGNSRLLASALAAGATEVGHTVDIVDLSTVMTGLLRDCRRCRTTEGNCSIADGYGELIHTQLLVSDAVVYATPLYWYGMSAALKNFFDRLVCYVSESYPRRQEVVDGLKGKRVALLLASEERYPGAAGPLVAQLQEIARYLHHEFVAVVNGVGNTRGEVSFDPAQPLDAAHRLGRVLFDAHYSDYDLDALRPNAVWPQSRDTADAAATPYADV